MSIDSEPSPRPAPTASLDPAGFPAFCQRVAETLTEQAADIAVRWERQSRDVALRSTAATAETGQPSSAVAVIEALASAVANETGVSLESVPHALAFGAEAFRRGTSLHHAVRGLDLLTAMVLYAVERNVSHDEVYAGSVADGVRLARRVQTGASLLTLAVTKGYTQAVGDESRDTFRHLRHDLRNPLGTIKGVLSMMDDETLPADARTNPRFRVMAQRNARSLDALIMDRLSDTAALVPALTYQVVSLRTIACSVRRDLRAEAEGRDITVGVSEQSVRVQVDAVGLELLLRSVLQATLAEAVPGEDIVLDFEAGDETRAVVLISCAPLRPPITDLVTLRALSGLAKQMGATLETEPQLALSLPVLGDASSTGALEATAPLE